MSSAMGRLLIIALTTVAFSAPAAAQIPGIAVPASPPAAAKPPVATTPAAIPVADISTQASIVQSRLREIVARAGTGDTVATLKDELLPLSEDADLRSAEARRLLRAQPSLDTIRSLQSGWDPVGRRADEIAAQLTNRVAQADNLLAEIDSLSAVWSETRAAALAAAAPKETMDLITPVMTALDQSRKTVVARRAEALTTQASAADLLGRVNTLRDTLAAQQRRAIRQLLQRDSPAIWQPAFWTLDWRADADGELADPLAEQWQETVSYVGSHTSQAILNTAILAVLIVAFTILRTPVRRWASADPSVAHAAAVFETPLSTALMLAAILGPMLYSQPPRLLVLMFELVAIVPVVLVVRNLIERPIQAVLYALMAFYTIDTLRDVIAVSPQGARVVFLIEMLLAVVFWLWLLRRVDGIAVAAATPDAAAGVVDGNRIATPAAPAAITARAKLWLRLTAKAAFITAVAVLLIDATGLDRLADEVGSALQFGAYAAIVLYALLRVTMGGSLGAFHFPGLASLGMVVRHRAVLEFQLGKWLTRLAIVLWIVFMLKHTGLWDQSIETTSAVLDRAFKIGSLSFKLSEIVSFFAVIYVTTMASRVIAFVLDEEVYPKLQLARGLPYAISTMVRYFIILIGVVVALSVLGIDMTKFTILAGAFSVGLGFGLQNIVNNFVSGLIVLFERPVKVGDMVQFGDITGAVERIGIRATVVRGFNGAEMIVPNGKLISDNVTNWTFSNRTRRLDIPVLAALGSDAAVVKKILLDAAAGNPEVAKDPPPDALLSQLGPDSLVFELRAWVAAERDWGEVRSDLASSVNAALRAAGIAFK